MMDLPDAPWIRETEQFGVPEDPPVYCPVCGEETDTVYVQFGEVIGCSCCVCRKDAYQYLKG